MNSRRKVIIITDGDICAQRTIQQAVQNAGGRCISRSGGNPTPIDAEEIINLVKSTPYDPAVIMLDDEGNGNKGAGEKALAEIIKHPGIEVIGIIAVASNTKNVKGVHVDFSIDAYGNIIDKAVDKEGREKRNEVLFGDTVDVIDSYDVPVVIGIGDIGKMNGKDDVFIGAPIVTKALKEIINRAKKTD